MAKRALFKTVKHVYVITGSRNSGKTRCVKEIARQILKQDYVYTDLLYSRTGLKLNLNNHELNDILGILSNGIDTIGIVSAGDELDVVMSSLAILEEHFPDVIICVASDEPVDLDKEDDSDEEDDSEPKAEENMQKDVSLDVALNGSDEILKEIRNHYSESHRAEKALLKPKFSKKFEEKQVSDFIIDEKINEGAICKFVKKIINDIRGF